MKHPCHRCPAEVTLGVIGGRWKVPILWHLAAAGMLRFSALRRALEGCTQKMLTQQLRELEQDGIVRRKVYLQVPPKVEYSLTPAGKSLLPVVESMCQWAKGITPKPGIDRSAPASARGRGIRGSRRSGG